MCPDTVEDYPTYEKAMIEGLSIILHEHGLEAKDLWREFDLNRAPSPFLYLERDLWKDLLTEVEKQVKDMFEKEFKNLENSNDIIEEKVNEEEYTSLDVAAAFLYAAMGENSQPDAETIDFGDTGAEEGMVRLFINIGKKQNIRPGDILGAIAGETGMPGKLIGTIDMFDKYTFVEVPREFAKEVLQAMSDAKIKGKTINIEPENEK